MAGDVDKLEAKSNSNIMLGKKRYDIYQNEINERVGTLEENLKIRKELHNPVTIHSPIPPCEDQFTFTNSRTGNSI